MHFLFYTSILLIINVGKANAFSTSLSLKEVEKRALEYSLNQKAITAEIAGAENKMAIQRSALFPKITIEGNYKYLSEVPSLTFPTGAKTSFGAHDNYSLGPAISWILFDFGATTNLIKSTESLLKSKENEHILDRRQILLKVRLIYFELQLKMKQEQILNDSLELAKSQYQDIQNKLRVGLLNRIDLLSAHKEVLNLTIQLQQLKSELKNHFRDLNTLIGDDKEIQSEIQVNLDPINSSLESLSQSIAKKIDENNIAGHPLISSLIESTNSLRFSKENIKANNFPKITLFAKSSIDYPNGPILKSTQQNMIGVSLSLPLFEGFKTKFETLEKENQIIAISNRTEDAKRNLIRDWHKLNEQLNSLKEKLNIYKIAIKDSEEKSKLVYHSYRLGRSNFIEVQSANLQVLETKIQAETNEVQTLIQLAYLASFFEETSI